VTCDVTPILLRRREAAALLAVSESQILKWERAGLLKPIAVPGIRAVRYEAAAIKALAESWIDQAQGGSDGE
jgi:hypothetical protein